MNQIFIFPTQSTGPNFGIEYCWNIAGKTSADFSSAANTLLRNKSVGDILNQNHDFIEIDWEHHN